LSPVAIWRRAPQSLLAGLLALVALGFFTRLAELRRPWDHLVGDEGTFLAMAESLARDGDLAFGAVDRAWCEHHPAGPVTVILERTARGVFYSKPILYPGLAAPFVKLLGEPGLTLFNALALVGALVVAWGFLRRLGPRGGTALTLVTFAGAGILIPLVAWRMTESLQAALALAGGCLAFGALRPAVDSSSRLARLLDHRAAPWVGAVLLGLLASLRDPNLLFVLLPAAGAMAAGKLRRGVGLAAVALAAWMAILGATWLATGVANPYRAERSSFEAGAYPVGVGAEQALLRFDGHSATQRLEVVRPAFDPWRSAYSALYFAVGRHTGLLVYFPALLAILPAALRRPDRHTVLLLGAVAVSAVFYVVWIPDNYFGGETFLGDRYAVASVPLLLVALRRLPRPWTLALAWCVAAALGVSAFLSTARWGVVEPSTQNHAYAGLFRRLPFETTARGMDGRRDRYWAGDLLRFVDPFSKVGPWQVTLEGGMPPAEVIVARWGPQRKAVFLASCDCATARLEVSRWRGRQTISLSGVGGGPIHQRLEIELPTTWRRHPFWWDPGTLYWVRDLSLRLAAPAHAALRLRYAGDGTELDAPIGREAEPVALPVQAFAGSRTSLAVRVRNTGHLAWTSEASVPVFLAFRLTPLAPQAGGPSEGRAPLAQPIPPGGVLDQAVSVDWPVVPGRYRLVVDLLQEDLAWFGDRLGQPLAAGDVLVEPAPTPSP